MQRAGLRYSYYFGLLGRMRRGTPEDHKECKAEQAKMGSHLIVRVARL